MKVEIRKNLRLNVFDSSLDKDYQRETTIIFIHGGAGCLLNWKHQLPYFSRKYRTIAYDWRGCGDSDEARSHTFDNHYTDFLTLLKSIKVPPQPILVGHSYGCLIARKYISEYRIDKFVNVSLGLGDKKIGWWLKRLLYFPRFLQIPIYKYLLLPKNQTLAKWLLASANTPVKKVKEFLDNNKIPSMEYLLGWKTFKEEESVVWIKNYRGRMLTIVGSEDKLVTVDNMRRLNKLTPNSRLEIVPNAGHLLPYETPEFFNKLVEAFIEESSFENRLV